ncbi:MAG: TIGR02678 family protein [Cellulosilyticaceae bacterium]
MEVLKTLLESNFILKEKQRELFYTIKDSHKAFKPFIQEKLGYELVIRPDFIRLEKRPGKAECWMGIEGFEETIEYVFWMLLFIFLEDKNKEDQFLLSHITDFIVGHEVGQDTDWTQYKNRRSLIKVLKVAIREDLIRMIDGEEESFAQDAAQEMLFESTGLSRYMVRNFQEQLEGYTSYKDFENEQENLINIQRGGARRNRVYRRLLLSPVVYQEGSNDEDFNYIKNYKHIIEEDFKKYLGWELHVHRGAAMVIPLEKDKITYRLPANNALSDLLLQWNYLICQKLHEGQLQTTIDDKIMMDERQYRKLVEELIATKKVGWSKEYREMSKERLYEQLAQALEKWQMLRRKADTVVILPLTGKMVGDYPKDFEGGSDDE